MGDGLRFAVTLAMECLVPNEIKTYPLRTLLSIPIFL